MRAPGLVVGDLIQPGRLGRDLPTEAAGTALFFREYLVELFREKGDRSPVSRLNCAFAFESRDTATFLAAQMRKACFEVEPIDRATEASKHDSNWIGWIGEPGRSVADVLSGIDNYWDGQPVPGGLSIWEWLIPCGLRIIGDA
jgi:hypothetical protein